MRRLLLLFAVALSIEAAPKTGSICIAPWHIGQVPPQPNMSQTTWPPRTTSTFEFRIGKNIKKSVRMDELLRVDGVPADRRVLIGVKLDGRPYESFHVDLRKERDRRACLWLYPGYWHWINTGWEEERGCRCAK